MQSCCGIALTGMDLSLADRDNPYIGLEDRAFWRTAIGNRNMFDISDMWKPKFDISTDTAVCTYGSCFAQHIGRSLRQRGFTWLITENPPEGLSEAHAAAANYGIFSSRTANVYTASLLKQWMSWATGDARPVAEVWDASNRFYDPFRPAIEPDGFESPEEVVSLRDHTIGRFRDSIAKADILVFTMGLTESWFHSDGHEYPMCPGTAAGRFDPDLHHFVNQDYPFILDNMNAALDAAKRINPDLKIILTVSPVPLTATRSGHHVLVATMESKSILRAVAGKLAADRPDTDYFPSYEIINGTPFGGVFFQPNKRNVHPSGVAFVMDSFFSAFNAPAVPVASPAGAPDVDDVALNKGCEEAMLEVYAGSGLT